MVDHQSVPDSSQSVLREEALELLDQAIRVAEPGLRKQLLARSFELIQWAEFLSSYPRLEHAA